MVARQEHVREGRAVARALVEARPGLPAQSLHRDIHMPDTRFSGGLESRLWTHASWSGSTATPSDLVRLVQRRAGVGKERQVVRWGGDGVVVVAAPVMAAQR